MVPVRHVWIPVGLVVLLTAEAAAADEWWGTDKTLHFGVSAGLASGGYAVAGLVVEKPWQRALFGGTVAFGAGAAKEAYDAVGPGDPSGRDLAWDAAGVAVGLGLAATVDALIRVGSSRRKSTTLAITMQSRTDF